MTRIRSAKNHLVVGAVIPWLIAACGLALYLTTLNHWISLHNLAWSASDTGSAFAPNLNAPLFYLATYPFHWLPAKFVPIALNLFSAVCAALTLALLARAVSLLPHDRTFAQRIREDGEFARLSVPGAWIPPVLAAAVLGLQLTIWESATNGAKEMLDLLVFAYAIRCLLEFRVRERDSWVYRAAFAYAAGMTGNWAMIALLPGWLFAILWIRGVSFFNLRFLFWCFVCGVAGLLFYLVLPLVYVNTAGAQGTLWQAMKVNLKGQKETLAFLTHLPVNVMLLLSLTSLLPVLLMGVRWASRFGDPSRLGSIMTILFFHLSHGAFLFLCLWAAFDPAFGLRHTCMKYVPGGASLLFPLVFISALCVGYFSGYFLLVVKPVRGYSKKIPEHKFLIQRAVRVAVIALLAVVSAGLIYKNLPRVRIGSSGALGKLTAQVIQKLPDRAVVLSDDAVRTFLVKSWIERTSGNSSRMFLDTQKLAIPEYYNAMQAQYRDEWLPAIPAKAGQAIDPRVLVQLMGKLGEHRPIYYLNPSFGYYFESFYAVPHGLVYELKRYPTNSVSPPALTDEAFAENEAFWKDNQRQIEWLAPFISEPANGNDSGFRGRLLSRLHVSYEPAALAMAVGGFYSLPLNVWGVQSQIAGHLDEARAAFERSVAMNPQNIAAQRNLEFNKTLRADIAPKVQPIKDIQEDFLKFHDPQNTMRTCGPFDDPSHRFAQGFIWVQGGLSRQAANEFERVVSLVPDYLPANIALARIYAVPFPQKTLAMIPRIQQLARTNEDVNLGKHDLLAVHATALYSAQRRDEAERLLTQAMEKNPTDNTLHALVFQISASFKSYANALTAVDNILDNSPDDTGWLVNKGYLLIQTSNYDQAIPPLTKALATETNNVSARFDRAIAYLGAGKLDEAKADYTQLEDQFPGTFQVYYGLGEIAWRRNETNNVRKYYDLYLANAPAGTEEAKMIRERFESLPKATIQE